MSQPRNGTPCLIIAVVGTVAGLSFRHSYHPSASDLPFVKIVNARQIALSVALRSPAVCCLCPLLVYGLVVWIWSDSEPVLWVVVTVSAVFFYV